MTYYDQTFEPWEIVDGKCVVADESEWRKLKCKVLECCTCDKLYFDDKESDAEVCDCGRLKQRMEWTERRPCLLYTSDAADE